MFSSFFGRKKDTPTDEPAPIPFHDSSEGAAGGEEYIFIERREPGDPLRHGGALFPSLTALMDEYEKTGDASGPNNPSSTKSRDTQVPYLEGVPFKMSAELCAGQAYEDLQFELDAILAEITNQAPLIVDYDFKTERSLVG